MIFGLALLHITLIFACAWIAFKRTDSNLSKYYWWALAAKLFAGLALGFVYSYFYTASDTFNFHHDALRITQYARSDFAGFIRFLFGDHALRLTSINHEPRTLLFVKVLSIVHLFTNDSYWISGLWFSFLSFISAWWLVEVITNFQSDVSLPAVIALLFFPTCVFWSSGVIKESLASACLFFLIATTLQCYLARRIGMVRWVLTAPAIYLLWNIKYYWAAALVLGLSCIATDRYLFQRYLKEWSVRKQSLAMIVIFVALGFIVTTLHPNFYLNRFLVVLVDNYRLFTSTSERVADFQYASLSPTWVSMVINAPLALCNVLFRPFPWEALSLLPALASLENVVLFLFFAFSLRSILVISASPNRWVVISTIIYILILAVFLGLSTPNFGTLSRYRIGFLPFFVILILYRNPLLLMFSHPPKSK